MSKTLNKHGTHMKGKMTAIIAGETLAIIDAISCKCGIFANRCNTILQKRAKIMKTDLNAQHNFLFNWASKGLKSFLLTLFGFAIAYILSKVFGVSTIVQILLSSSVWEWLFRIAVFIFCFFALAIIYESFR